MGPFPLSGVRCFWLAKLITPLVWGTYGVSNFESLFGLVLNTYPPRLDLEFTLMLLLELLRKLIWLDLRFSLNFSDSCSCWILFKLSVRESLCNLCIPIFLSSVAFLFGRCLLWSFCKSPVLCSNRLLFLALLTLFKLSIFLLIGGWGVLKTVPWWYPSFITTG